jgi:sigma54-dependent transcription regulator
MLTGLPPVFAGDATMRHSSLDADHLPQRMHDLDQIALGSHHRIDRLVRGRRLVHHLGVLAAFDVCRRPGVVLHADAPARLGTAHHPTRAMAAAVEAVGIAQAAHDEAFRAHAARNDAELTLARAHRTLAGDEHILAVVVFAAHVVVMAIHRFGLRNLLKSGIATRNAAFNRMIEQIETVATRSKAPMLLMGPTGAGKSQLGRRVFELKKLKHQLPGRFVEVNCATLRGDGAMSTLFGHTKGAYTGASSDRAGLLRSAHQGLLFLDEIGELGLDEQAMLLRALEEKRFLPVGSDKEVESDFQLIAGTNSDLQDAVGNGRFREDLLARLNLWTYRLPGLAERHEDIEPNLDFELERWSREQHQRVTFNKEARARFLAFAVSAEATWSGNFRDLGPSVMRMATLANAGRIQTELVDEEIVRLRRQWRGGDKPSVLDTLLGERVDALDRFDRVQLEDVVRACAKAKSLSQAGRDLFAVSRSQRASTNDADRLRKYLARFGLDWEQVRERTD